MHRMGAAVLILLLVAACGTDADPVATGSAPTSSLVVPPSSTTSSTVDPTTIPPTSSTTPGTTEPATTTTSGFEGTVVEVTVSGGGVDGGGRVAVELGSEVRLSVTADVADEVHVHGYDLTASTAPGEPGILEFTADIPGVFEVELHESGLKLVDLEVAP